MAAVTICSDFGAQENKICHCFHFFPIYLSWSGGTRCIDIENADTICKAFSGFIAGHSLVTSIRSQRQGVSCSTSITTGDWGPDSSPRVYSWVWTSHGWSHRVWTRFCVTPFTQGGGPELVHCRPSLISFSFLFSLLNGLLLVRTPRSPFVLLLTGVQRVCSQRLCGGARLKLPLLVFGEYLLGSPWRLGLFIFLSGQSSLYTLISSMQGSGRSTQDCFLLWS